MSPRQKLILQHLEKNPNASYTSMKDVLKVDHLNSVIYAVKELMATGYLKRNNRWHLTKQAAKVLGERAE